MRTRSSLTGAAGVGRRRVVETELRAHRAADRARIDVEALAGLDRELNVARDRLDPDRRRRRPRCTRTSPETVVTDSPAAASPTERSPETRLADEEPTAAADRRVTGGGAEVSAVARRRGRARHRSPCRPPGARTSSSVTSPDAVLTSTAPSGPVASRSAELAAEREIAALRAAHPDADLRARGRSGNRSSSRSARRSRARRRAPSSRRGPRRSPCRVTSLSRSAHELDLDAAPFGRLDGDLAAARACTRSAT